MKNLEKTAAKIVNKAISIETFGWPPGCMGTLYQPERPQLKPDKKQGNKQPQK